MAYWSAKNTPAKQKVDPDAPGTPGKPGYEPPVHITDYLTKDKSSGPWEKETELTKKQQQEKDRAEEVDHNVGAKMDGARDFLRLEK